VPNPPPPRTKWTRRVPSPVPIGHAPPSPSLPPLHSGAHGRCPPRSAARASGTCAPLHRTGGLRRCEGGGVTPPCRPVTRAIWGGWRGAAGTLDKLESIPGFTTQLSEDALRAQLADPAIGCAIISPIPTLCPVAPPHACCGVPPPLPTIAPTRVPTVHSLPRVGGRGCCRRSCRFSLAFGTGTMRDAAAAVRR